MENISGGLNPLNESVFDKQNAKGVSVHRMLYNEIMFKVLLN